MNWGTIFTAVGVLLLIAVEMVFGIVGVFLLGLGHPLAPGRASWMQAIMFSAAPFAVCAAASLAAASLLFPKDLNSRNTALVLLATVHAIAILKDFLLVTKGDQELMFVPIQIYGTCAVAIVLVLLRVVRANQFTSC